LTPRTDAHALHDLLVDLRDAEQKSLQNRWAQVLDAPFRSPEFVRRHAEVVSLLSETLRQISALPNPATRERFEPYTPHWWAAVVAPNAQWNAGSSPTDVITGEHLHLLGSAADIIDAQLDGSVASPASVDLDPLHRHCLEWIETLSADTEIPKGMRLSLLEHLRHVVWLIENAEHFGVARVAQAAQTAAGAMVLARPHASRRSVTSWTARINQFCALIASLTMLLTVGQGALEAGQGFIGEVGQVINGESPGGAEAAAGDEVVDAELVDETEDE
jgi:hypothetical protein